TWIAAALSLTPGVASAQASLVRGLGGAQDYGTDCLPPQDDGYSQPIDVTSAVPGGLNFFGTMYRQIWVNTNGSISFRSGISQYTPDAFPGAPQPMIAPFWADVDLRSAACNESGDGAGCTGNCACRNPSSNGLWWHLEPGRIVVTWDRVGYYQCNLG